MINGRRASVTTLLVEALSLLIFGMVVLVWFSGLETLIGGFSENIALKNFRQFLAPIEQVCRNLTDEIIALDLTITTFGKTNIISQVIVPSQFLDNPTDAGMIPPQMRKCVDATCMCLFELDEWEGNWGDCTTSEYDLTVLSTGYAPGCPFWYYSAPDMMDQMLASVMAMIDMGSMVMDAVTGDKGVTDYYYTAPEFFGGCIGARPQNLTISTFTEQVVNYDCINLIDRTVYQFAPPARDVNYYKNLVNGAGGLLLDPATKSVLSAQLQESIDNNINGYLVNNTKSVIINSLYSLNPREKIDSLHDSLKAVINPLVSSSISSPSTSLSNNMSGYVKDSMLPYLMDSYSGSSLEDVYTRNNLTDAFLDGGGLPRAQVVDLFFNSDIEEMYVESAGLIDDLSKSVIQAVTEAIYDAVLARYNLFTAYNPGGLGVKLINQAVYNLSHNFNSTLIDIDGNDVFYGTASYCLSTYEPKAKISQMRTKSLNDLRNNVSATIINGFNLMNLAEGFGNALRDYGVSPSLSSVVNSAISNSCPNLINDYVNILSSDDPNLDDLDITCSVFNSALSSIASKVVNDNFNYFVSNMSKNFEDYFNSYVNGKGFAPYNGYSDIKGSIQEIMKMNRTYLTDNYYNRVYERLINDFNVNLNYTIISGLGSIYGTGLANLGGVYQTEVNVTYLKNDITSSLNRLIDSRMSNFYNYLLQSSIFPETYHNNFNGLLTHWTDSVSFELNEYIKSAKSQNTVSTGLSEVKCWPGPPNLHQGTPDAQFQGWFIGYSTINDLLAHNRYTSASLILSRLAGMIFADSFASVAGYSPNFNFALALGVRALENELIAGPLSPEPKKLAITGSSVLDITGMSMAGITGSAVSCDYCYDIVIDVTEHTLRDAILEYVFTLLIRQVYAGMVGAVIGAASNTIISSVIGEELGEIRYSEGAIRTFNPNKMRPLSCVRLDELGCNKNEVVWAFENLSCYTSVVVRNLGNLDSWLSMLGALSGDESAKEKWYCTNTDVRDPMSILSASTVFNAVCNETELLAGNACYKNTLTTCYSYQCINLNSTQACDYFLGMCNGNLINDAYLDCPQCYKAFQYWVGAYADPAGFGGSFMSRIKKLTVKRMPDKETINGADVIRAWSGGIVISAEGIGVGFE